jgi:hypothetical protein
MLRVSAVDRQELQRDARCEPDSSGLLDTAAAAYPG